MNIPSFVKNKYTLYGGVVLIISALAYRLISPTKSGDIVMTAQGMSEGNLAMVQTAQEFALKSEQLKVEKEIAMQGFSNERYITDTGLKMLEQNNSAYLTGLEATNQFSLASQTSAQDYALANQMELNELARYFRYEDGVSEARKLDQEERIVGANLATQNAWKSAEYADKQQERIQAYNLANYQTMVEHDIGKKQVKAQVESGRLNFLGSVAQLFS